MNKLLILFVGILLLGSAAWAQPQISQQFLFYPELFNPARAGFIPEVPAAQARLLGLLRTQWTGFDQGESPGNQIVSMHGAVNDLIGAGIVINNDSEWIRNRLGLAVNGAYYLLNNPGSPHKLAIGLSAGFINHRIQYEDLPPAAQQDPVIMASMENNSNLLLDANIGLRYSFMDYRRQFHFDISTAQLPAAFESQTAGASGSITSNGLTPYLLTSLQARAPISDQIDLAPVLLLSTTMPDKIPDGVDNASESIRLEGGEMDFGLRAHFWDQNGVKELFWLGAGARTHLSGPVDENLAEGRSGIANFHAGAGFQASEGLNFNIGAEFQKDLGPGFHIGLSYTFGNKTNDLESDKPIPFNSSLKLLDRWLAKEGLAGPGKFRVRSINRSSYTEVSYSFDDSNDDYSSPNDNQLAQLLEHIVKVLAKIENSSDRRVLDIVMDVNVNLKRSIDDLDTDSGIIYEEGTALQIGNLDGNGAGYMPDNDISRIVPNESLTYEKLNAVKLHNIEKSLFNLIKVKVDGRLRSKDFEHFQKGFLKISPNIAGEHASQDAPREFQIIFRIDARR